MDNEAVREMIHLVTGGWRAQAIYTAVKLHLPDRVKAGHTTSADLAAVTGANPEGIHRLMRLLVTMKVFSGSESSGYRNTPLSGVLLEGSNSMEDLCMLYGEEFYVAWSHAYSAISTASSGFEIAYGEPLYSYLGHHPDTAQRFQRTMNSGNMFFHAVPEALNFQHKTVVDVGGGGGHLLACILGAVPSAQGVLFDREHMMPKARAHLAETVGLDRVRLAGGDMFSSVPEGGHVYLLCRVLAGWDDEAVVTVFRNCRQSMKHSDAQLVILDRFVQDEATSELAALWDLHLMVTTGGRHRSLSKIEGLLERAGFEVQRVADLPMETSAVIATPTGA